MSTPWPTWILAHPRTVLLTFVAITAGSLSLALQVRFDYYFQNYYPEGDPVRETYRQMVKDFPGDASEFVVVVKDTALFTENGITALKTLTDSLEASDWFAQVLSPVDLPKEMFGVFGPIYQKIIEGGPFAPNVYDLLRQRMVEHPLLHKQLVFAEGNIITIRATAWPEHTTDVGRARIRGDLAQKLAHYEPRFDDVFYTGFSGIGADFAVMLRGEQRLLLPVALLVLILVLFLFLGRTWLILLPMLTSGMALTWTLALMALGDASFTILSSGTPLLVLIIGIADSLHLFYFLRAEISAHHVKEDAIIRTFQHLGRSCFLTSITTTVGFWALVFTKVPVLQEFGLYTGLGIIIHYIVVMGLLPVLLHALPKTHLRFPAFRLLLNAQHNLIGRLAGMSHHARRWLPVFSVVVVIMALGCLFLYQETSVYQGLAERNWLYHKINKAESYLGGVLPFGVSLHVDEAEQLTAGETLQQLEAVQTFLDAHRDVVGSTFSLVDIVKWLGYVEGHELQHLDWSRIQAAPLRRRLLTLQDSDIGVLDTVINFERQKLLIRCRLRDVGSRDLRDFLSDLEAFTATQNNGQTWRIAGIPSLAMRLSEKVTSYIITTFSLTCVVIFVAFWLSFGALKMAVISIIPNVIPLLCILGFLGWADIPLQPSVLIVFSIVYGIAVNDTIHFLSHFSRGRRQDSFNALDVTLRSTAMPILSSSAILIAGFSVLLLSEFLGLLYLGLLLGVGIGAALFSDLLVLPALLRQFGVLT